MARKVKKPSDWPDNRYADNGRWKFNPVKSIQDPLRPAFKRVIDDRDKEILLWLQEKGIIFTEEPASNEN